jgi:hypothetical protein
MLAPAGCHLHHATEPKRTSSSNASRLSQVLVSILIVNWNTQ